jgi:hypothetical protein
MIADRNTGTRGANVIRQSSPLALFALCMFSLPAYGESVVTSPSPIGSVTVSSGTASAGSLGTGSLRTISGGVTTTRTVAIAPGEWLSSAPDLMVTQTQAGGTVLRLASTSRRGRSDDDIDFVPSQPPALPGSGSFSNPEPKSIALLTIGMIGTMGWFVRKRRKPSNAPPPAQPGYPFEVPE